MNLTTKQQRKIEKALILLSKTDNSQEVIDLIEMFSKPEIPVMENNIKVLIVGGRGHVLRPYRGDRLSIKELPNYMGTGLALCGVTKKGESLEHWRKRTNN
jgi:hypothetical protein